MGNVIVPVGIRHPVVQIAVERAVMQAVTRVTVKKGGARLIPAFF